MSEADRAKYAGLAYRCPVSPSAEWVGIRKVHRRLASRNAQCPVKGVDLEPYKKAGEETVENHEIQRR